MKYYVTDYKNNIEKKQLEQKGLYCYDLRSGDNGEIIATIEENVLVNRVGSIITNEKIHFDKYPNHFIDYNTFCLNHMSVDSIKDLLEIELAVKNREKNKFQNIKKNER